MIRTLTLDNTDLAATHIATDGDYLLVLAHGAGAPHDHPHMTSLATSLVDQGISTLRFNFPFMQAGKRRVDSQRVSLEALDAAINTAKNLGPGKQLLLGGHSFGGRMATHLLAELSPDAQAALAAGVLLFSFPLHPADKPETRRALHLPDIRIPMLFLSGTRDKLAYPDLMAQVIDDLPNASLKWLSTADHGFKILKRTRTEELTVYEEAAATAAHWLTKI